MLELECSRVHGLEWQIAHPFASQSCRSNILIRRAKLSDAQYVFEMHQRLSLESIHSRYLRAYRPNLDDQKDICSIDENEGFVLIASIEDSEEKVVGIAYYCVEPNKPSSAEPAILIEDEYQGHGLGKQLSNKLCQYALKLGVKELVCYAHPSNRRLLRMIEGSGMRFENNYCEGMNKIRVLLDPIS